MKKQYVQLNSRVEKRHKDKLMKHVLKLKKKDPKASANKTVMNLIDSHLN